MTLVRRREYVVLLIGDVAVFVISLWGTLFLRYWEIPESKLFLTHLVPFSLLFVAWVGIFFLAGLYGKYTRLFRGRLPTTIFYAQIINVALAALFFFLIPAFGLAPKTILALYLLVSSALIYAWRVPIFSHLPYLLRGRRLKGVLIASGPDSKMLAQEVANDRRYPFAFVHVIDTSNAPSHEVIQQALRLAAEDDMAFLVVDFSDKAFEAARPIIYNTAFHKERFAIIDIVELYQEVFDRVPLSLISYEWMLSSMNASRMYGFLKRALDIVGAIALGIVSLPFYPFVALLIKLEDGGPIFISQERVGRYQRPIRVIKFRSMTGNDKGEYGEGGKTKLSVTRVGNFLRRSRIDELPQLWAVLKGDLSLVGPRPEFPALSREYSAKIPYYNARHLITPGLTGWAQIRHHLHPHHAADIQETKTKLSYDLYYLKHRSLFLDVFIILQTTRIILTARGS
ncbi:sugar transferase [Candidatus Kaiserbacteria bacterium]|nr:sugar transferase [Candidatus Kaiserbacteria bacterium]